MGISHLKFVVIIGALALIAAGCADGEPESAESLFEKGVVAGLELASPTVVTWGPDDRLYVAELDGRIVAVEIDFDEMRVVSTEVVAEDDDFNQVLGMTFDPASADPALYVSHNFIMGTSAGNPFANEIVRLSGPSWDDREVVISGLPVSLHDHGTNALHFDSDGRLFIAQGGSTTLGAPGEATGNYGNWDESPLSGAILVADLRDPSFDGHMAYDADAPTAGTNLIAGSVRVYSPGHRNTFGFVIHSNGEIYSLDNGSSEPAPVSLDCDTLGPPPDNEPDQLNRVVEGAYYGHPNRNRGRTDPEQCSYVSPREEEESPHMMRLVPPSSNAIIEFRGEFFNGEWDGDLLYAWWSGGEVRRLRLSEEGTAIMGGEQLVASELELPLSMVQAPDGTILIAEFGSGFVSYLKPAA